MTGPEKIAEATKTVNDIKTRIQDKYDRIMGKIETYQQDLRQLALEADKHSKQWINEKTAKIKSKIEKLKSDVEEWLQTKMKEAQDWLAEVQKEIQDFIKELLASMILALAGV